MLIQRYQEKLEKRRAEAQRVFDEELKVREYKIHQLANKLRQKFDEEEFQELNKQVR